MQRVNELSSFGVVVVDISKIKLCSYSMHLL